jgi:hypothetical protein
MSYEVKRELMEHGRIKFYLSFYGRGSEHSGMWVTLSMDGCISPHVEKGFFYSSEADAFADALLQARQEHESRKIAERKKWDSQNGDTTSHFGCNVSLSINDTIAVLKTAPIKDGKIFHAGKWLEIYRTDLKDDVGLKMSGFDREFLQSIANYGARVSGSGFGIVTSFSDG